MTILSVVEKTYNLFWNDMDLPGILLTVGIALAVIGIAILSNYRMDGLFGFVPRCHAVNVVKTLIDGKESVL